MKLDVFFHTKNVFPCIGRWWRKRDKYIPQWEKKIDRYTDIVEKKEWIKTTEKEGTKEKEKN